MEGEDVVEDDGARRISDRVRGDKELYLSKYRNESTFFFSSGRAS